MNCLIIIPCYNAENTIKRAINSALNQSYENITVAVIDDCSTDNSLQVIESIKDERLIVYKNIINKGSYNSINIALQDLQGTFDCFMLLGADDTISKNRVIKQLTAEAVTQCQYQRYSGKKTISSPMLGHSMLCVSNEVFKNIGYFDNTRFAGDSEYFQRIIKYFGTPKAIKKVKEVLYKAYNTENSLTNTIKINSNERQSYCKDYSDKHNIMQKENNYYVNFIDKNRVIISMATMPERVEVLKSTVNSLLPQCDELHIYLNNFTNIPEFLQDFKIICHLSNLCEGDLGDVGKFYGLQNKIGYLFSVDDDLIYPPDYVQKMITGIKKYNSPVTLHGKIFNTAPIKKYYSGASIKETFPCLHAVKEDKEVQIAGSGVFAYHSNMINFDIKDFKHINMSDIYCSILCHKAGLKMFVLAHEKGYIKEQKSVDVNNSIWAKQHRNDIIQTTVFNEYFTVKEQIKILEKPIEVEVETNKTIKYNNIKEQIIMKCIILIDNYKGTKLTDKSGKPYKVGDISEYDSLTARALIAKKIVKEVPKEVQTELDKIDKIAETNRQNLLISEAKGEVFTETKPESNTENELKRGIDIAERLTNIEKEAGKKNAENIELKLEKELTKFENKLKQEKEYKNKMISNIENK